MASLVRLCRGVSGVLCERPAPELFVVKWDMEQELLKLIDRYNKAIHLEKASSLESTAAALVLAEYVAFFRDRIRIVKHELSDKRVV